MKILIPVILLSLITSHYSNASTLTNDSFSEITQLNSWTTANDIYLKEEHHCSGSQKTLYKLPKTDNQQYSLLLSAFSAGFNVKLSYVCASNDYPEITAVRVRK